MDTLNFLTQACEIEQANYLGWQAIYLRNGLITVVIVPDIGGRIMAYDLGDFSYLYVNRDLAGKLFSPEENQGDGSLAAWKNYGGDKTWPAPQGWDNERQWHGPPDPILDSGRYQIGNVIASPDRVSVELTSPHDPKTGLQISRRITLYRGSSRLSLDLTFTNISERLVQWSIWDVVQLQAEQELADGALQADTSCVVTTPINPASCFQDGFNVMFGAEDNPQWQVDPATGLFIAHYLSKIGKVGIDSPTGWIAFANERRGYAFSERFVYDPLGEYPDAGATVECWTTGSGVVGNLTYENSNIFHMETEVLSPLYTFQPGECRTFQIEWGACRLPGRVTDVQSGGCVQQPFTVSKTEGISHIYGVFGSFDQAACDIVGKDEAGNECFNVAWGAVTPLNPIQIDLMLEIPAKTKVIELQTTAVSNARCRLITSTQIN